MELPDIEQEMFDEQTDEKEYKEQIRIFCIRHYSSDEPLLIKKFREDGFTNKQIYDILTSLASTCDRCWDAPAGCNCWNDE